MLKKNKQKILKIKLNNLISLKFEVKNIILKSINQNNNLNNKQRFIINLLKKKSNIKKNKKICLISGQHRSVDNRLNFSKQNLNYLSKLGLLQNFQIKSW